MNNKNLVLLVTGILLILIALSGITVIPSPGKNIVLIPIPLFIGIFFTATGFLKKW